MLTTRYSVVCMLAAPVAGYFSEDQSGESSYRYFSTCTYIWAFLKRRLECWCHDMPDVLRNTQAPAPSLGSDDGAIAR